MIHTKTEHWITCDECNEKLILYDDGESIECETDSLSSLLTIMRNSEWLEINPKPGKYHHYCPNCRAKHEKK